MSSFKLIVACSALAGLVTSAASPAPGATVRPVESFDFGWRFHSGDIPGAEKPDFADRGWRALDLPHDWSIEGPYDEHAATGGSGGYLPTGVGWYRKAFALPESVRGQSIGIEFDGVYRQSTAWINGHELGTRPYGYSSFRYDLTPFLHFDGTANVLAVRVDNSAQPNSRWYSGSGIYRHTWLTVRDPLHVAPWGVTVTTPSITGERAVVHVRTRVENTGAVVRRCEIIAQILDAAATAPANLVVEMAAGTAREFESDLVLASPRLWSPASPALYRLRMELRADSAVVDACETSFGVRTVEFSADRGLVLNGVPVKMRGLCLHHDAGAVGAAVPVAVLERRLRLLQEMGCNAIRCSHNPMAPEFYDLCDRLGLLVMDEAFDEWTIRKPQIRFGYSDVFADWSERDLVAMIQRDRNHPCIVLWSAGNEIGEQGAPAGPAIVQRLVEIFHREDPTRPVTAAMDNIFNQNGRAPEAFTRQLDVVGYNYVDRWGARRETQYTDDRALFPQRKFVGTENAGIHSVRGDYRFGPLLGGGFDGLRAAPGHGPEGALYLTDAIRPASLWRFVATHDYVSGDFIWTGFDYLGEAHWPNKLASSGPLDTCGFRKDAFYFYQSIWTAAPMVHLLPHWNWPDRIGKTVPVVAYSNCAAVELFLNGRSLGAKAREFPAQGNAGAWNKYAEPPIQATTADFQLVWDVPYEPGELKAIAYDRHGAAVASTTVKTSGPAAALELTLDRADLAADARDVVHATVRALDARGVFVPLADDEIHFELSGPARLIGVDNGDPASHASYHGDSRALFHGLALALVQATRDAGAIRLTARAAGLKEATVEIKSDAVP